MYFMSSAVCRVGTEGSEMRSAMSEGEVRSSLRHSIAAFSRPTADLKPVGTHDGTRNASSNGYIPPIFYYALQYIESTALVTYSFSIFSLCVSWFFLWPTCPAHPPHFPSYAPGGGTPSSPRSHHHPWYNGIYNRSIST
jgi:hypothetical protein